MNGAAPSFEGLLREALAPVDPPAHRVERLEGALLSITEMAADELEAWELGAMRDPRNWVRPAAAVLAGGAAGSALLLLRARRKAHAQVRPTAGLDQLRGAAAGALHEITRETRRLLERS